MHISFPQLLSRLTPCYESRNEARSVLCLLLEEMLNVSSTRIYADLLPEISEKEAEKLDSALQKLEQGMPVQYVLGYADFGELRLRVEPGILIPRPETLELIEWITSDRTSTPSRILDVGTGSGCIAISLAKHWKGSDVEAWDISETALQTAKHNAEMYHATVKVQHQDVLTPSYDGAPFDLIVSNPPYVRTCEKSEMQPRVLEYEPDEALFVSDDRPLVFYEALARLATQKLRSGGQMFMEINQYLPTETAQLFKELGFEDVELKNDSFHHPRMLKAVKP